MSKEQITNAIELTEGETRLLEAMTSESVKEEKKPAKAKNTAKEEKKAFYTYALSKKQKIEFIESKKSLENLIYKAPCLMRLIVSESEKKKYKDIFCLKLLTVKNDHTMMYSPKNNEYFIVPVNREFDLSSENLKYYYDEKKQVLEKIEVISLKTLNAENLEKYNEAFEVTKVKDNK